MSFLWRKGWTCPGAAIAMVCLVASIAAAQTPTTLPKVTGSIPVTADSYPQMAWNRTQEIVDLSKIGYVEEEYIVSGTANVYKWNTDGSVSVKTPNAPYATRIILRRPADAARFSGTVIVELLNEARGYDWSFLWAMSNAYIAESGHAFLGITHVPGNVDSLKKFNPTRYASLSWANPTPTETCGPQNATSPTEEGLRWDMVSQVGALLKSKPASGPLAGFNVQHLYMSSHHAQVGTYAIAIHSRAKLADGKPVYDGYLVKNNDNVERMSRCDEVPAANDPRLVIKNVGVPVIRIAPQGAALRPVAWRADSDAPDDRFRHYEVAGTPHMDKIYFDYLPLVEDQVKMGQPISLAKWPTATWKCTPDINLLDYPIQRYLINGAWANLDRWVRTGTPPPKAERLEVTNRGTQQAAFVNDEFGNAKGGIRHTYVDVPTARYVSNTPGSGCANLASKVDFDWNRLESIYGSSKNYADKVTASIDRMVRERWITQSDGNRMRAELIPTSAATSNNN